MIRLRHNPITYERKTCHWRNLFSTHSRLYIVREKFAKTRLSAPHLLGVCPHLKWAGIISKHVNIISKHVKRNQPSRPIPTTLLSKTGSFQMGKIVYSTLQKSFDGISTIYSIPHTFIGWVSLLVDHRSPRAHIDKFCSRLRLLRNVLRAKQFSVFTLMQIVILWILVDLILFRHFWTHMPLFLLSTSFDHGTLMIPKTGVWCILLIS